MCHVFHFRVVIEWIWCPHAIKNVVAFQWQMMWCQRPNKIVSMQTKMNQVPSFIFLCVTLFYPQQQQQTLRLHSASWQAWCNKNSFLKSWNVQTFAIKFKGFGSKLCILRRQHTNFLVFNLLNLMKSKEFRRQNHSCSTRTSRRRCIFNSFHVLPNMTKNICDKCKLIVHQNETKAKSCTLIEAEILWTTKFRLFCMLLVHANQWNQMMWINNHEMTVKIRRFVSFGSPSNQTHTHTTIYCNDMEVY